MLYHPRRISVDTTHLAKGLVAMALVADDVDILPAMPSPVLSRKAVLHDERPVSQDTHSQDTHRSVKISQDQSRYTQSRQKLARLNLLWTEHIITMLAQVSLSQPFDEGTHWWPSRDRQPRANGDKRFEVVFGGDPSCLDEIGRKILWHFSWKTAWRICFGQSLP